MSGHLGRGLKIVVGVMALLSAAAPPAQAQVDVDRALARIFEEWKDGSIPPPPGVMDRLANLGTDAAPALPRLIAALHCSNSAYRAQAAQILANLGPAARPAIPALIDLVRDSDQNVRQAVAAALSSLGSMAEPAIPALVENLRSRSRPSSPRSGLGPGCHRRTGVPRAPRPAETARPAGPEGRSRRIIPPHVVERVRTAHEVREGIRAPSRGDGQRPGSRRADRAGEHARLESDRLRGHDRGTENTGPRSQPGSSRRRDQGHGAAGKDSGDAPPRVSQALARRGSRRARRGCDVHPPS